MEIIKQLSNEFNIKEEYSKNIVELIADGNTIPFIARYRKEMHGACDDQVLREFADRLKYLENLNERKNDVAAAIIEQEKMTPEIAAALAKAQTMTEVEDIYRPFKKKKKTRAMVAVAAGLEPVAKFIRENQGDAELDEFAKGYICENFDSEPKVISGAMDIIAENASDDADMRKILREVLSDNATINTKIEEKEGSHTYEMYKEFSEKVSKIPGHRVLAINRGEKEEFLKVSIVIDEEMLLAKLYAKHVTPECNKGKMEAALKDSLDRLIFPSLERELRNDLTDMANEGAIKMFELNLQPLLMQPPLKNKVILGLDPAYRTGCKVAIINCNGDVLETGVVYPTPPQSKTEEAEAKLTEWIYKHEVDVISIGNGTATKETEIFTVELMKKLTRPVKYAVVNESGASVYSASKLGAEEFPQFDVSLRSAVSIARRLQDPLAELIKIDVKSIGVGQYQHDMPQKRLAEVLEGVVEGCVNNVGVDLNTASYSLLSYVAGLNVAIAKNIVAHRAVRPFSARQELLNVAKLGAKAFEQCAGFLRIIESKNILDNTAVHPEAYPAVEKLLAMFNYTLADVRDGKLGELKSKISAKGEEAVAKELAIGVPTMQDIANELLKPGRDIRSDLPEVVLRADLLDIKNLKAGMEVEGVARNIIDFGVFVDIGVHQDGLVHISQISRNYIKHPSEVLKVGDRVRVKVLEVDPVKNRISLTMLTDEPDIKPEKKQEERSWAGERNGYQGGNRGRFEQNGKGNASKDNDRRGGGFVASKGNGIASTGKTEKKVDEKPQSLDEMLKALQNKFGK